MVSFFANLKKAKEWISSSFIVDILWTLALQTSIQDYFDRELN